MRQGLPEQLSLTQLAAAGGTLQGAIGIAQLSRLSGLAYDPKGTDAGRVVVELKLLRDEHGTTLLTGRIQGNISLCCERCLKAVSWPLDLDLSLHLVSSDSAAEQLPAEVEALVVAEDELRPRELVEDEIILALPLVPRHPDGAKCGQVVRSEPEPVQEEKVNPFSVLKNFKV